MSKEIELADRIEKISKLNESMGERFQKFDLSLFKNKHVRITLLNGDQYEDILKTDSYNRYGILLEINGKRILIPKHSYLS